MATGKTTFFESLAGASIDSETGTLKGVSVITEGEAKGHGIFVDSTMLKQTVEHAGAFKNGIRVKENHGTGVDGIVGTLRNFSINGNKVVADLHLLKTHQKFSHIIEMAKQIPESFGLSLSFSMGKETIGGKDFARCLDIYSADLVDQPAANPSGLFTADVDTHHSFMNLDKFIERAKAVFGSQPEAKTELAKVEDATKTELSATQTKLAEAATKLTKFEADLASATTLVETLKASQKDFEARLETASAAKAQEILAKTGHPGVKVDLKENPAAEQVNTKDLKGREKFLAAFSVANPTK